MCHSKGKQHVIENIETESKTLIIQLERQIREKDKSTNLLKPLNDSQSADSSNQVGKDKASEQTQRSM